MWFKQVSVFVLDKNLETDVATWQEKLSQAAFKPCQGLEWQSEGFTNAVPFAEDLIFNTKDTWRLRLRQEDKVLPSAVIKEFLDEAVANIQQNESRTVGRKEKNQLKEQITDDLLPRAFVRSRYTEAVLDLQSHLLFVNQSNPNKSEHFVSQLRQALGGLPASLPRTNDSATQLMSQWLSEGAAAGNFELDCDCELKGTGDVVPVVKISKQDLCTQEVKQHLEHGKICTQLGLIWNEQIRFVLNEDLSLKRIQYLDMLQEEAANQGEDLESLISATQLIMTQNLSLLVNELIDHLNGLQAA